MNVARSSGIYLGGTWDEELLLDICAEIVIRSLLYQAKKLDFYLLVRRIERIFNREAVRSKF